jgi:hypothetical protein
VPFDVDRYLEEKFWIGPKDHPIALHRHWGWVEERIQDRFAYVYWRHYILSVDGYSTLEEAARRWKHDRDHGESLSAGVLDMQEKIAYHCKDETPERMADIFLASCDIDLRGWKVGEFSA